MDAEAKGKRAAGMNSDLITGHERTVLAYLMTDHDACDKFLHRISEHILFVEHHRKILAAIRDVHDERENVNLVTVSDRLYDKHELEECGGRPGITEIATSTTSEEIAESALDAILDDWRGREAAKIGKQLITGDVTPDLAEQKLRELNHGRNGATELSIRSPEEILAIPRDAHSNLLGDRLFAKGQSVVMVGIGGIGKTRLLGQLLVALIVGRDWCGLETHGSGITCLLFQTENSNHRLQDDLAALKKWAGKDWPLVNANLRIHTLETDADSLLYLSDPDNVRRLEAIIRKFNPVIVGFDPLRDFGIGDLNSDLDMAATVRELGRISRVGNPERGLAVLHHALTGRAGVAKAFGLERTGFARNSKVLHTWSRGMINVVPGAEDDNETLILTCGKNSNGKEFPSVAVRLNPSTMIYEVAQDYDIEAWREHVASAKGNRTPPVKDALRELLLPGRQYDKTHIATLIMEDKGVSRATAFRWVDLGKTGKILHFNKTIKTYELT
jgi:AAA domain-containing protein/DnaB helicase-like protein